MSIKQPLVRFGHSHVASVLHHTIKHTSLLLLLLLPLLPLSLLLLPPPLPLLPLRLPPLLLLPLFLLLLQNFRTTHSVALVCHTSQDFTRPKRWQYGQSDKHGNKPGASLIQNSTFQMILNPVHSPPILTASFPTIRRNIRVDGFNNARCLYAASGRVFGRGSYRDGIPPFTLKTFQQHKNFGTSRPFCSC